MLVHSVAMHAYIYIYIYISIYIYIGLCLDVSMLATFVGADVGLASGETQLGQEPRIRLYE